MLKKLFNEVNRRADAEKRRLDDEKQRLADEEKKNQNFIVPYPDQQPRRMQRNYPHGYFTQERMQELNYDPRYRKLVNMLNAPQD